MQNEQNSYIDNRWEAFRRQQMSAETQQMFDEFQYALESGVIALPTTTVIADSVAGGVNYCPNSDLKYSRAAVETPATTPATAGDDNLECYRFYRQPQNADIATNAAGALKAINHSLFEANEGANGAIPVWDRVIGQIVFGASSDPLYDVAVNLYNNDAKPAEHLYASFVVGALTPEMVPADLEMYVGIWIKTADYEGWAMGGNFLIQYRIVGVRGTRQLEYLIVARTDAGDALYSQIVSVNDAPNAPDAENFVRLSYGSAQSSGFIQFEIYRRDVAADSYARIADIRNANQFIFDDALQGNEVPVQNFPAFGVANSRAFAQSRELAVGVLGGALPTNSFTIAVPVDYNISETLNKSQFLRFGFTRPCAVNRQIRLDKIYLGPTYNQWSDSPFDPTGITPSTSATGGTPTVGGGGSPPNPGGGGGACILETVPVLRLNFCRQMEFMPYKHVLIGDPLEIGRAAPNIVRAKRTMRTRVYYRIDFTNGAWVFCNKAHGFCLDKFKKRAKSAEMLKEGNKVWGWNKGREGFTRVKRKTRILVKTPLEFGTFSTSGDNSYVCGHSLDGQSAVFCPNNKPIRPTEPEII